MPEFKESKRISGVQIADLNLFADKRGYFQEFFRKEWFPQRSWESIQCNRSQSATGVLRGLHYHNHQVDYWYVARGKIRAGLVDLRVSSPTFGAAQTIEMSDSSNMGLFIPIGVAHGFFTIEQATLFYVVDNYYDGSDEYGLAWNDPDIELDWGTTDPLLSQRDMNNPRLRDIPKSAFPP